jgi:hypothetical protein
MKLRNLIIGLAVCLASLVASAQLNLTSPVTNQSSFSGEFYDAPAYGAWQIAVFGLGSTAGGTYSISLYAPAITLADGRRVAIFGNSTLPAITIGSGATTETVTPSSATGCGAVNTNAAAQGSCVLTATFANAHGKGDIIVSGDSGYQEAVNDAANNGGGNVFWYFDTGVLALATGATTTTYSQATTGATTGAPSNFFPIGSYVLGVTGRVTTTITSACTGWEIGDGTTAARWTANNTGLTAGTVATNTGAAWTTGIASTTTGYSMAANKSMVITCAGGNPGAGAVRVKAWGYTPVGSN